MGRNWRKTMKRFGLNVARTICDLQRKASTAILPQNRNLFDAAATLIGEFRDRLEASERIRTEMEAVLKEEHGCSMCKHWSMEPLVAIWNKESNCPCTECSKSGGKSKWQWKGTIYR